MGLGAMAGSCTNLDEKIYDRLVDNNCYKNEKDTEMNEVVIGFVRK